MSRQHDEAIEYDASVHMTMAELARRLGVTGYHCGSMHNQGKMGHLPDPLWVQKRGKKGKRAEVAFDRHDLEAALLAGAPKLAPGWHDVPGFPGVQMTWEGNAGGRVRFNGPLPAQRSEWLDALERQVRAMSGKWLAVECLPTTQQGDTVRLRRVPPFIWG